MSDLGGGRASNNGGARTSGPVPVSSTSTPPSIRTPRDVMRDRTAREARRQEEQKAEEARRVADDRRRSAERRAVAVSRTSQQYPADAGAAQQGAYDVAGDRRSRVGGGVSGAEALGEPVGRVSQDIPSSRPRRTSETQQEPSRASQAPIGAARRSQQSQSAPRQASQSSAQPGAIEQRAGSSSFPHAFERWEALSSHWEGLTSYWLHKLESNTEEIRGAIPNASVLNRQITDLSAAGANLFHAVVELQRLRASSERKFQRWFFETRAETERSQETFGQAERQLKLERNAREEASSKRAEAEEAATVARREVAEMRRELAISKDEARRAWEELGRRNQEAVDTANDLKEGRIAVVAGVQVVPYFASRTNSAAQRPATRDGQPQQYGSATAASSAGAAGLATPGDEREYYRQNPSPSNTDPFTEQQQPLHHEPGKPSLAAGTYQPHPAGSTPTTSGAASQQTVIPRSPPRSAVLPQQAPEQFYQQGQSETFLHSPRSSGPLPSTAPPPPRITREDVRSEGSAVDTLSEGDTEYAIDAAGNIRHDSHGRPIVFRGGRVLSPSAAAADDEELDEDALRRERELSARYGGGSALLPEAPSIPATSAQAMQTYTPTTGAGPTGGGGPDYEGQGYGNWEALQTRHHHPTRLSDVLEEDEERSSRRTGGE